MENVEREQLEGKLRHIKDMLLNMRKNYKRAVQLNDQYNQVMASYQNYEEGIPIDEDSRNSKKRKQIIPIVIGIAVTIISTLIWGGYTCYLYNGDYWDTKTLTHHYAPDVEMTYFQGCLSAFPKSLLKGIIASAILFVIIFLADYFANQQKKKRNIEIQNKNIEIQNRNNAVTRHNNECDIKIQNIYQEAICINNAIADLQSEYRQYIRGWYPEDMAFDEAVDSFISDIHNYRADNMKEAQALFIQKKQHEILNNNMLQGFAVISSKIDNLAEIERYNGQLLRMTIDNQEILIKQADVINRNLMMGFASVNFTNIMNTASINRNIASAANSVNANINAGAQSINRKLDDIF